MTKKEFEQFYQDAVRINGELLAKMKTMEDRLHDLENQNPPAPENIPQPLEDYLFTAKFRTVDPITADIRNQIMLILAKVMRDFHIVEANLTLTRKF